MPHSELVLISGVAPLILAVWRKLYRGKGWPAYVFACILASLVFDAVEFVIWSVWMLPASFLSTIFDVIMHGILMALFGTYFRHRLPGWIPWAGFMAAPAAALLELQAGLSLSATIELHYLTGGLIVIGFCGYYYYRLMVDLSESNLSRSLFFWVVTAYFLYFAVSLTLIPVFTNMTDHLEPARSEQIVRVMNLILVLVKQVVLTVCLWRMRSSLSL